MNRNSKIILAGYLILGVIIVSGMYYMNNYALNGLANKGKLPPTLADGATISEAHFIKIIDVNKKDLFNTMTKVKDYSIISPDPFASVKIINQTNNTIYTQEELIEKGIKTSVLVKHRFLPYEVQSLEILDGDARGSIITAQFEDIDNSTTKVTIKVQTILRGLLSPFSGFTSSSAEQLISPIIDNFVEYARGIDNKEKKSVDQLYMEILHRHADKQGLDYFSQALQNGKMTINDVRNALLNSDEYKLFFTYNNTQNTNKIDYKKSVDQLYMEILHRHADKQGLDYFSQALQNGKMTINDVRNAMLNSDEYKNMQQK